MTDTVPEQVYLLQILNLISLGILPQGICSIQIQMKIHLSKYFGNLLNRWRAVTDIPGPVGSTTAKLEVHQKAKF